MIIMTLPHLVDGSLGLSLQERAELASACRHALRIYSRERCHLPGRILARLYDGLRHMHDFGYWSENGIHIRHTDIMCRLTQL